MITSSNLVALLTPPGLGALAVVTACGPAAVDLVGRLFAPRGGQPLADRPDGTVAFGHWGDPERGEELVVVRHAADHVEVHCHGGLAASAAVLESLTSLGARPAASFSLPVAESRTGFSLSQKNTSFLHSAPPSAPQSRGGLPSTAKPARLWPASPARGRRGSYAGSWRGRSPTSSTASTPSVRQATAPPPRRSTGSGRRPG